MRNRFNGLLAIHLAVFLFGVSGLFGKFLDLTPSLIVFGRTLFASIALAIALVSLKLEIKFKRRKDLLGFLLMGIVLAIHWVTFFHSIQISTVAIGLLTFSTFPIFVTFLEPLFFQERVRAFDIAISIVVFIGLVLVIPEFDLANNLTLGVFWGTVSGFTFAILSVLNRKSVANYPALTISLYQDAVACVLLLPFVGQTVLSVTPYELGQLVLLGVIFTALAHTLFIGGMLVVKAQLASVIACLEPLYGILLALVLLAFGPKSKLFEKNQPYTNLLLYSGSRILLAKYAKDAWTDLLSASLLHRDSKSQLKSWFSTEFEEDCDKIMSLITTHAKMSLSNYTDILYTKIFAAIKKDWPNRQYSRGLKDRLEKLQQEDIETYNKEIDNLAIEEHSEAVIKLANRLDLEPNKIQ